MRRPSHFWQRINMHDPPQLVPLIGMWALICLLLFVVISLATGVAVWVSWTIKAMTWTPASRAILWPSLGFLENVHRLLANACVGFELRETATAVTAATSWSVALLAALSLFQQSMHRYRIRQSHIVRLWMYAGIAPMVLAALALSIAVNIAAVLQGLDVPVLPPQIAVLVGIAYLVFVWGSIRVGCRYYLRMPHCTAVAVAAQFVAVVLAFLVSWLVLGDILLLQLVSIAP